MRGIVVKKGRQFFHPHLGISYTAAMDSFERCLASFNEDIITQSIKSIASSKAGCTDLNVDLIDSSPANFKIQPSCDFITGKFSKIFQRPFEKFSSLRSDNYISQPDMFKILSKHLPACL